MGITESGRRNIVVIGAGFGGITALLKLHRLIKRRDLLSRYQLILVNRGAYHLYTPSLYEMASIPKAAAGAGELHCAICIPIDDIIGRSPAIRFIGEEVVAVDPERHTITLASANQIPFEYLVVALGAQTNFFGIPGMAEHALPLKTFADAVRLRNRAEALLQNAAGQQLQVVVVGGGATGVELSAELVHFFRELRNGTPTPAPALTIIEAAGHLLSGFPERIVHRAELRLAALGITALTATTISRVEPGVIVCADGRRTPYHLLIWSGGVSPASATRHFNLPLDRKGGIVVNEFLEARPETGAPATREALASGRIYAIGDNASFINPKTGASLPGNIPVAEAEAWLAATNIVADITGRTKRPFRPLARYPFILAVGGKYALTDLVIMQFFGFAGWVLKQLVELRYLLFILPWPQAISTWFRMVYYSTKND